MPNTVRFGLRTFLSLALFALTPLSSLAQSTSSFNLPAQPLAESLRAVGAQLNLNVMVSPALVDGKQAPALKAQVSAKDALTRLLTGTGLEYHFVNDQTVVIRERAAAVASKDPAGAQVPDGGVQGTKKEEGKKSSQDFRVGGASSGQDKGDVSVANPDQQTGQNKFVLDEIVVTGSRIPVSAMQGPQELQAFSREQIEQSGQSSISDFLNTVPVVAVSSFENFYSPLGGATTVQLHGLPAGTTLVLINGRRVETSGAVAASDVFDLNNIPLAAVERIEIVPAGSSAVYGSDAIAGVVNIILKSSFEGVEINAKQGWASATHEQNANIGWGGKWEKGTVSLVASFQDRTELQGFDRSITGDQNYTRFGGVDARFTECNPGNVFSLNGNPLPGAPTGSGATFAASPNIDSGRPTLSQFSYGTLNTCSLFGYASIIPATRRWGLLAQGTLHVSGSVEVFSELLLSHVRVVQAVFPPLAFGVPGFQSFTVPASNPYNPFGETVGISYLFTDTGDISNPLDTTFFRPLIGVRGRLGPDWTLEASAWDSADWSSTGEVNQANPAGIQNALNSADPSTALNPFIGGAPGSQGLLRSLLYNSLTKATGKVIAANAFIRGPIAKLPTGPLEVVVGTEYDRDTLATEQFADAGGIAANSASHQRHTYAVFGEARLPLWTSHDSPASGDRLSVTLAGRYDHYDDFGGKSTPQFGVELRPIETLLIRGSYSDSFKAPSLYSLYTPVQSIPSQVTDPNTGQTVPVTINSGGNPNLRAESGLSRTVGLVYASNFIPKLRLSVTQWRIDETDSIQSLPPQAVVSNANLFPGAVIRYSNGNIITVNDIFLNFGRIEVAGIDYQVSYQHQTPWGSITPALSVTQTYHYRAALTPGSPVIDATSRAQDTGDWSPRWKGTATLGWQLGPFAVSANGRYVGSYYDYPDLTPTPGKIGNFWRCDATFRYAVGQSLRPNNAYLKDMYVEVGGVNIFNKLPQYSDFNFGTAGYDPYQSDIRGRFIYAQFGGKW